VGAAARDVDDVARRRGDPFVVDVDRELAALDAVDLGRLVAVQGGRSATRRQPDLDGEEGAVRLGARDAEGEVVGTDRPPLATRPRTWRSCSASRSAR